MSKQGNHSGDCYCHHLPNLVAVTPDRLDDATSALGERWERPGHGELCQILDGLDHDIVAQIQERVGVLRVTGDTESEDLDPHEASRRLNEEGIAASPVHGVGYTGHAGFQGSQWVAANTMLKPGRESADAGIIAVVDSGISPDLAHWMDDPNVMFDRPIDTERPAFQDPVSHGTFVISLLRRLAPELRTSIASARPDPGYLRTSEPYHPDAHTLPRPPTDELNVLGAVLRLIRRHGEDEGDVRALNLSLGAHECPEAGSDFFLSLQAAVDAWRERFPKAPIVAAGGNSTCTAPVYPAAFEGVKAVAAAREGGLRSKIGSGGGEVKVWHNGTEVNAPDRDWITDVAPGCDIIGLSGQDADHTIKWSGSSFATAVVSALIASNRYSPTSDEGKDWTPDRAVTYGDVNGLVP